MIRKRVYSNSYQAVSVYDAIANGYKLKKYNAADVE
jgi:hypothetical protein